VLLCVQCVWWLLVQHMMRVQVVLQFVWLLRWNPLLQLLVLVLVLLL
jgi:hypothetical protein